jgi:hypothetical protein
MLKYIFSFIFLQLVASSIAQSGDNEILMISAKRESCIDRIQPYPNPSSDGAVFIAAPEGAACHVASLDGTFSKSFRSLENGLDMDNLPSGTYVVVIQFGQESIRRKFVVL